MKIDHLAIRVDDLEPAGKFYEQVFGFLRTDTPTERGRTSCHLADGATDPAMVEFREGAEEIVRAAGDEPCIHHLGIDVADVEAYAERVKRGGAEILDDHGSRTLEFRVPGGRGITETAPNGWHARRTGNRGGEA